MKKSKLAILCGGGPAPGMNGVISAVTIEACKHGWEVFGIYEGYSYLAKGIFNHIPLNIDNVSRIHVEGGSILRTARYNPTKDKDDLLRVVDTLQAAGITHLVTIGGDDTAFSSFKIAQTALKERSSILSIAHVPKTIDNDLPLPEGIPTFGYETARQYGALIVSNLMEDALTTGRWFLCVAMGRTAGHLALGIGKSAAATITLIPEEFTGRIGLQHATDIIAGSVIKRMALGKKHGVAIVAEGLIERIRVEDFEALDNIETDEHGHLRYAEINFSDIVKNQLQNTLKELGIKMTITDKEIGYELRCAPPNSFDIEYTRNLGYAAFEFLNQGGSNAMVTIQNNGLRAIPLDEILNNTTGKTQVRLVNPNSIQYRVARQFMIRLERTDFEDPEMLSKLAQQTNMTPEAFTKRFRYLADM